MFPIEWLVVKNIQHLGTINIDSGTQAELRDLFRILL